MYAILFLCCLSNCAIQAANSLLICVLLIVSATHMVNCLLHEPTCLPVHVPGYLFTWIPPCPPAIQVLTTLYGLERTIAARQQEALALAQAAAAAGEGAKEKEKKKPSWTVRLLQDPALLCSKIR